MAKTKVEPEVHREYLNAGDVAYVVTADYSTLRGSVTVADVGEFVLSFDGPLPFGWQRSDMLLNFDDYSKWANTYACEDTTIVTYAPKSQQGFRRVGR